jgi:hypothetical protein
VNVHLSGPRSRTAGSKVWISLFKNNYLAGQIIFFV